VQMADLCVMSEEARFSYPEAKLGFTGGLISGLVARIPHKVAMELLLVGEDMTAQRAYEVGFVNKVVPFDQVMSASLVSSITTRAGSRCAKNQQFTITGQNA